MSVKADAKEAAPDKAAPDKGEKAEKAAAQAPAAGGSGLGAWIPALAAVVLAPAVSFAVAQFVLLPRLQKQLAAAPSAAAGEAPAAAFAAEAGDEGRKEARAEGKGKAAGGNTYDFTNVVVNLAGTMGTRYLKTSFTVSGADATFKTAFESNKAHLTDVTLSVLSSLSLADLEEPGAKNVLRDKLISAYNQVLGGRAVEQVYFSDFLVQ